MELADLHIHALYGVDDGAKTEAEMQQMIDASYADGVRTICLTPHFHPGYFGDNYEKINLAYSKLQAYTKQRYPGLQIFLGNELRYSKGCISWLKDGLCRTINHTRYVLVDFSEREGGNTIIAGIEYLLNAGYIPILAHVERYGKLGLRAIQELRGNGVLIQIDIQSLFGGFGWLIERRAKTILARHLADLVASDAHDLASRPPGLSNGYRLLSKNYGESYADAICRSNALQILYSNTSEENANGSNGL